MRFFYEKKFYLNKDVEKAVFYSTILVLLDLII
jgi:hypothetical protein